MELTIQANRRGSAPVYAQVLSIEGHATGVDLVLPNGYTDGTISKESAIAFGRLLLSAAGAGAPSESTPTTFKGWKLEGDTANGFDLVNPLNETVYSFLPVSAVVHYA